MKLIALIDDDEVIEKILRHLKLWPEHAESARLSRAPPSGNSERNVEPYFDDPFPDYPVTIPRLRDHVERDSRGDTEPVMAYDPACHGVVPRRKRSGRRRNFAT